MLENDEIGLETPRSVSIGLVLAARLAGGVAVVAVEACAALTHTDARAALSVRVAREALARGVASGTTSNR